MADLDAGSKCLVCGVGFDTPPVWCADCRAPAHRDCFTYNGQCATYGCQGRRFDASGDTGHGTVWIERPKSAPKPGMQAYIVDYTSNRESLATFLAGGLAAAAFVFYLPARGAPLGGPGAPMASAVCVVGALLAWLARVGIRDHRVVDANSRAIWDYHSIWGFSNWSPEVRFEDCKRLYLEAVFQEFAREKTKVYGYRWRLKLARTHGRELDFGLGVFEEVDEPESPPVVPEALYLTGTRISEIVGLELRLPNKAELPEHGGE